MTWLVLGLIAFGVVPVCAGGWIASCVYREYRHDRVPILLYHRLISRERAERGECPDDEMIWACYDDSFSEQMTYLASSGYTTLDLDDYLRIRRGLAELPAKPIIVTFDDGYESNYSLAFPVLLRLQMKATIFVVLEPNEYTRRTVLNLDGFLTAPQLLELSRNNVSIQSHTLTHPILTELDDVEVARELTESRHRLSQITETKVEHLAIPRAGNSRRVRRLARRAGYKTICGNHKGTASGLSSLTALPRIVVERDMGLAEFARALRPRTGSVLRLVGFAKRLPGLVAGPRLAFRLRNLLYHSPLRVMFRLSILKWVLALFGIAYILLGLLFWNRLSNP